MSCKLLQKYKGLSFYDLNPDTMCVIEIISLNLEWKTKDKLNPSTINIVGTEVLHP